MDQRQFENGVTPSFWVSGDLDVTKVSQEWQVHLSRGLDVALDLDIAPYIDIHAHICTNKHKNRYTYEHTHTYKNMNTHATHRFRYQPYL